MHAQPPPQPPPAVTAEQQQDLDCVSIGVLFGGANGTRGGWNSRMARFYLFRLEAGDQSRDWRGMVRPVSPTMTYREFMERMAACREQMPAPRTPSAAAR